MNKDQLSVPDYLEMVDVAGSKGVVRVVKGTKKEALEKTEVKDKDE